jgi:2-iminobutanoate/2-iminopropanoate deaminase
MGDQIDALEAPIPQTHSERNHHAPLFQSGSIAAPAGNRYHHGAEVAAGTRMLYLAGQTGTAPDGSVPGTIEEQSEQVYRNIQAILEEAGMGFENVVKMTAYLIDREDTAGWRASRLGIMGEHRPAHTLVYIAGLANPDFKVEVEAIAADDQGDD